MTEGLPRAKTRALYADEVHPLLDACQDGQLRTMIFTTVTARMRLVELLDLRSSDIDLNTGAAHIASAARHLPGAGSTFHTTKNGALTAQRGPVPRHRAQQARVHPKVVSERLGHSTISITLDTYSHVLPDMQRDAAVALDAILSAGR